MTMVKVSRNCLWCNEKASGLGQREAGPGPGSARRSSVTWARVRAHVGLRAETSRWPPGSVPELGTPEI